MAENKRASSTSSRISACSACRRHKVRCDAVTRQPQKCSRCYAKGLRCEITSGPVQARPTRRELQNELESLRQSVKPSASAGGVAVATAATDISPHRSSRDQISESGTHQSPTSLSQSAIERQAQPTFPGESSRSEVTQDTSPSNGVAPIDKMYTTNQNLNDLEVGSEAIDACFDIFFRHQVPHVPILEEQVGPNACYTRSPLLFWAIVAVGARSYDDDPTLLTSLATRLPSLLNSVILARENPLATIQALALLCSWPMPFTSLSNDTTPLQAGLLLSHAFLTGLNVQGTGQDFHDAKLKVDNSFADRRARLWYLCITVCQRVHCCHGLLPPAGLDTHEQTVSLRTSVFDPVLARIVFEKRLSAIQSSGIMQLERLVASTEPRQREVALGSALENLLDQLQRLEHDCYGELGKFYLGIARLQMLIFQLLIPRDLLKDSKLQELHDLACTIIETLRRIEEEQLPPRTISRYAPIFVAHYSILAAFTILKMSRSHLSATLDASRGRKAYFFVIQLLRNMSVQSGDAFNRTMGILTQLWSSKNIFKRRDGTIDSLTLRCGGRLAMSVVYDCYWWWRWEFAGQAYPYDEENVADGNTLRRAHPRPQASDRIGEGSVAMPATSFSNAEETTYFANQAGTEWFGLNSAFLEDYWLGAPDLRIMDWAPPLINSPLVSADGTTMADHMPNTWHSGAPQS